MPLHSELMDGISCQHIAHRGLQPQSQIYSRQHLRARVGICKLHLPTSPCIHHWLLCPKAALDSRECRAQIQAFTTTSQYAFTNYSCSGQGSCWFPPSYEFLSQFLASIHDSSQTNGQRLLWKMVVQDLWGTLIASEISMSLPPPPQHGRLICAVKTTSDLLNN